MSRLNTSQSSGQASERNRIHEGSVLSVQLATGGTDPGPASKMSYTVAVNDVGTLVGIVPGLPRWPDEWDVEAIKPGTPVFVASVRGQMVLMVKEERATEECP